MHTCMNIDFESRSSVDLKRAGAYKYWLDSTTSPWGISFVFDDEEPRRWMPGEALPDDVVDHVKSGRMVSAWNAPFEWCGWNLCCVSRFGFPALEWEQLHDTAAWAAAMNLPRGLGDAAMALGIELQKDDEGRRLMLKMAKPRKPRKGEEALAGQLLWHDTPENIGRLMDYCDQDVRVERAIQKLLVPLSAQERQVWLFDQTMNARGVRIDLDLVEKLGAIAEASKSALDKQIRQLTKGAVHATTSVSQIREWLDTRGVVATSLDKEAVSCLLAMPDLPEDARAVLECRQEAAKSSTAKLAAMVDAACPDGRARHLHLYHGASTGRWSGRLIQTQNMPRGTGVVKAPEKAIPVMMSGDAEMVDLFYGKPMSAVSDMLRSCLVASPGHRLLAADYSSIEGRVTAWIAGEDWKLEAFRDNDTIARDAAGNPIQDPNEKPGVLLRKGPGMYELTASKIFDVPVTAISKKDPRRQVGKVAELALGFQGGVMAFDAMAKVYGLDMAIAYDPLTATVEPADLERAQARYAECFQRGDQGVDVLSKQAWLASEITKVMWRRRHPATVEFWSGIEAAVVEAVREPGSIRTCKGLSYIVRREFLWCMLPSRRCLAYAAPRLRTVETPWGAKRQTVSVMGVDSMTKRWRRYDLYGGILTENVVQAIARDLMAHGMLQAEAAGYPIILTIHDEAVADVPDGHGSLHDYEKLLCDLPPWAAGIPVSAEGYEADRYKKD